MTTFTVLGLWYDDQPLAAGAVPGEHIADGDLDYIGFQPWACRVDATSADAACAAAVERMRAERYDEDGLLCTVCGDVAVLTDGICERCERIVTQ